MAEKIEQLQLEQWLWGAANILRGPVDASDFKAYIFPLLFLKRISDVFEEERATALALLMILANAKYDKTYGQCWSGNSTRNSNA